MWMWALCQHSEKIQRYAFMRASIHEDRLSALALNHTHYDMSEDVEEAVDISQNFTQEDCSWLVCYKDRQTCTTSWIYICISQNVLHQLHPGILENKRLFFNKINCYPTFCIRIVYVTCFFWFSLSRSAIKVPFTIQEIGTLGNFMDCEWSFLAALCFYLRPFVTRGLK